MKRILILVCIVVALLIVILIGNDIVVRTKEIEDITPPKIVFIEKSMVSDFWVTVRRGAELAAKERGIELEYIVTDETDRLKEIIGEIDPSNVDGIIIASNNFNIIKAEIERIYSNNVKVLAFDEPLDWEHISGYIAIDNMLAGELIANEILKSNKSKIAIINSEMENESSRIKEDSLVKALSKTDMDLDIIVRQHCGPFEYDTYNKTLQILDEYPDIDAIAALNLVALEGAVRAVYESEKDISVFGLNNTNYLIDMLERDVVRSLVVQPAFNMGFIAVNNITDFIEGKKINREQIMELYVINKHNIYSTDNQRLLFPVIK